jgi:hypothetical protein
MQATVNRTTLAGELIEANRLSGIQTIHANELFITMKI